MPSRVKPDHPAVREARERITPALMTMAEAAVYLAMNLNTLRDRVYNREIPSVRMGSGQRASRRLRRADLDAWIARQTDPALRVLPGRVEVVR